MLIHDLLWISWTCVVPNPWELNTFFCCNANGFHITLYAEDKRWSWDCPQLTQTVLKIIWSLWVSKIPKTNTCNVWQSSVETWADPGNSGGNPHPPVKCSLMFSWFNWYKPKPLTTPKEKRLDATLLSVLIFFFQCRLRRLIWISGKSKWIAVQTTW